MQPYNCDKELVKDFLKWVSDNHKCALVAFPDEFSYNKYVNYKFIDTCKLLDQFLEERKV